MKSPLTENTYCYYNIVRFCSMIRQNGVARPMDSDSFVILNNAEDRGNFKSILQMVP